MLLMPTAGQAFNFNSIVDDVGNAVKSGAAAIEDNVRQILPGDDKNNKQAGESPPANEGPAKPIPQQDTSKAVTTQKKQSSGGGSVFSSETSTQAAPVAAATPPVKQAVAAAAPAPATPKASRTGTVFSKEPINPAAPPPSTTTFAAGDRIYGMLKASKPWKELLGSSDYLITYLFIDGQQKVSKTIGLKRPELLARDYVIIDIAPSPSAMTSYADRDIVFPDKDGYKFGPELFTKYLSELSPGNHTFRLEIKAYGDIYASGEFSISGGDFSSYAALLGELKGSSTRQEKMPKAGMTNLALENEMIQVLKKSGWPEIRRLVIVDKDWWLNRVSGGDSPVSSRHIMAAAAAKDAAGGYYYCKVTFDQPKLISGGWGKMEITLTSDKKPIPEENINL